MKINQLKQLKNKIINTILNTEVGSDEERELLDELDAVNEKLRIA
jgi:hypothetical protein